MDAGGASAGFMGTEPMNAADGAIVKYPSGYFAQFSPVTASDMIARLPGFSLSGGDSGRRGLADSFGNLLIDGRRPSNKSLGLNTVLQRIPAGDVAHVEIIREALPEYDMRGHGQLVNVILREGAGRSVNYTATLLRHSQSGRVVPSGEIFYSDVIGTVEFTLGLEAELRGRRELRDERILDADRDLTALVHDEDQRRYWEFEPSISIFTPAGENGQLRFDADSRHWNWRRHVFTGISEPSSSGPVAAGAETLQTTNFGNRIGATLSYAHAVSDAIELETTVYAFHHDFEDGPERFEEFSTAGLVDTTIIIFEGEVGERVLRQSLSWTPSAAHAFDFAAEGAFNYRDTTLDLLRDDGVTIAPIPLPVSDTRVEERRGELSANHVWAVRPGYSLESALRYEVSEIMQTGDVEQQRSFAFIKPAVALVWTPDSRTRWRVAAERDVAQLQFDKFASSVNLTDDTSTLGNPDYKPQNTWTIELEWERRFGEDTSLSVTLGRDWVNDLDDFIPIYTPSGVFDAPGNIGDGDRRRVTVNWSSPLDALGIRNAVLDGFVEWYDTEVKDPLTGEQRPFSDVAEWETRLDFRQSFPESGWAWGWDYAWRDDRQVFRARELRLEDPSDGDLDVYVETTYLAGMTARLGADFIFNTPHYRERIIYDGSRAAGTIARIEERDTHEGARVYFQLRGTL